MTAGRTPVMVISGHTMALAVVRALGEAGVPLTVLHYDPRDMAQASRYVMGDIRIPNPMHDEPGFVEALLHESSRRGGSVLIPASDESMVAVSRNLGILARHYIVAATDWATTERFIDKSRTYALATDHGIPVPRTLIPQSEEELELQAQSIGFPLLLKPIVGHLFYAHFKRKMVRVDTNAALVAAYRQAVQAGLAMMLQEIIEGDDDAVVNYNAYTWDGEPLAEFTARQLRKAPPGFGSPRVAISEWLPEVVEPGRRILAAMDFRGFSCTEFKLDRRDGTYKLMEVNGRHNLSGLLAVRCGVNFPLMQYRHLAEGVIPSGAPYPSGFYWTDAFRDVGYSLAYSWKERHTPAEYLTPYARRHCDAIFDRHDMGPFWTRLWFLLRNAGGTTRAALSGWPDGDRGHKVTPMNEPSQAGTHWTRLGLKRLIDLGGALAAAILLLPVLAGVSLAVAVTDGRPILFRQRRPGLHGRPFTIHKFRTMRGPRADEVWYLTDEQRITRLGRFLRAASLDELPELWNVIRGDMSLVGPRPLLMEYLDQYTPDERRRQDMRPGITGWAVVNGRNTLQFKDRLKLDVWYIENWSLLLDLRILAMTVGQVLRRTSSTATEDLALGFPLPGTDAGRAAEHEIRSLPLDRREP